MKSDFESIVEAIPTLTGREREILDKHLSVRPRTISLAIIENDSGQLLVNPGFDPKRNLPFYRPIGGGTYHGEYTKDTVVREFGEETGLVIEVRELLSVVENIFTYTGRTGHEIMFLYRCVLQDVKAYTYESIPVREEGRSVSQAVWKSIAEIRAEGAKLFPEQLLDIV